MDIFRVSARLEVVELPFLQTSGYLNACAIFNRRLFGHCHGDLAIGKRHLLLWERIMRIV